MTLSLLNKLHTPSCIHSFYLHIVLHIDNVCGNVKLQPCQPTKNVNHDPRNIQKEHVPVCHISQLDMGDWTKAHPDTWIGNYSYHTQNGDSKDSLQSKWYQYYQYWKSSAFWSLFLDSCNFEIIIITLKTV